MDFISHRQNLIVVGASGVGKSYISQALGYQACINGIKTMYTVTSRLFRKLKLAKVDGSYLRELDKINKMELLILDMKKKELIQLINQLLEPIGFKRKGNFWVINGDEITKIVNLQKSQYNDSFYINYGYIINSIPLDGMMMHVYNRLHSIGNKENESIAFLLNLNNEILDQDRIFQLTNIIEKNMITELVKTNTEKDILSNLKNRPHLNDIPLVVKRYLKISLE